MPRTALERNASRIAGIAYDYHITNNPLAFIDEMVKLAYTVAAVYGRQAPSSAIRIMILPYQIGKPYEENDPYKARNGDWVFAIVRSGHPVGFALRRKNQRCDAIDFSVETIFYHV